MTKDLGESIKNHRIKANLTQKDLAEKLNVSFQTVSKYENGINEPDLSTLQVMCTLFGCSISELLGEAKSEEPAAVENKTEEVKEESSDIKPVVDDSNVTIIQVGTCPDCGKKIYSNDKKHMMTRSSKIYGTKESVNLCDDCFIKHQRLDREIKKLKAAIKTVQSDEGNRIGEFDYDKRTVLAFAIIMACIGVGGTLACCILKYDKVGLGWTIGACLIAFYVFFAHGFCYFTGGIAGEFFIAIATIPVKFPRIIFSLTAEGIAEYFAVKIAFWILGIAIEIFLFMLAFFIASLIAVMVFPINLIYNLATKH